MITAAKGLTPGHAATLIKATYNGVFTYGMEVVAIYEDHTGQNFMNCSELTCSVDQFEPQLMHLSVAQMKCWR